ncbi:hypothetical protein B0T22DRAFT_534727 [Podospora appendiculata]|uniref:Cns1/TTC4 wheel domain-containing protein n=1 Tax=Podospora appendiculata TaxID=314037 RepID=A0AAE0X7W5_9PEZI|nr:hypothetical protein B0T22DRAFT_534727 [Podospora appendiculata]
MSSETPPPDADAAMAFPTGPMPPLNTGMTVDETWAEMRKHPLFMTELDMENEAVEALQALAFEGTPLENGLNFKDQGNECFRERRWADAKEFYAKGVALLAGQEARRRKHTAPSPQETDDPAEVARERTLLEQLYGNRAACNLELRNYRACTLDCAGALRLNPANVKALYRSARALLAVGRVDEAADACRRGLDVDPASVALKATAEEIEKKARETKARMEKEKREAEQARHRAALLRTAIRARGIRVRSTGKPPDMEDAKVQLVPDPSDPQSTLSFPTLLLYPVDFESDFVKAFNETETLDEHFAYIFPLPWDKAGVYTAAAVECYMETVAGGLIKVGRRVPLLKVLGGGSVEVVDELVKIFVVPKGKAEGWVRDFKAKRAEEMGKK